MLGKKRNKIPKNKILVAILILTSLVCIANVSVEWKSYMVNWKLKSMEFVSSSMEKTFLTGLSTIKNEESFEFQDFVMNQAQSFLPLLLYYKDHKSAPIISQDSATYAMILEAEANCENYIDVNGNLVGEEPVLEALDLQNIDLGKLTDSSTLLSQYYVTDKTAAVDEQIFDAQTFLDMDMSLKDNVSGPQILIYHTHSQEDFTDSVAGDESTSIVGVGAYLAELLEKNYGVNVLHHKGVYDLVDGKLDRSNAYNLAQLAVVDILDENPSIEVVIDDCVIIGQI